MTDPKVGFSIRVPKSLYDKMARVAKDNERSIAQEGRRALESHVQKHERKIGLASKP